MHKLVILRRTELVNISSSCKQEERSVVSRQRIFINLALSPCAGGSFVSSDCTQKNIEETTAIDQTAPASP